MDEVLCTNYIMQNVSLGSMKWVAGTVVVPARFKSKLPVLSSNFLRKVAQGVEGGRRIFVDA